MLHYHYLKKWRALLLSLPLLMSSLTGLATNYAIDFGSPVEDRNMLIDATRAYTWTYSTEGTVSNFYYSERAGGLCFYLEKTADSEGSLSLTTLRSFSGIFEGLNLFGDEVDRLVIKVYVGQRELGEMEHNGNAYEISGLTDVMMDDEPVTLKFMIAPNSINYGQDQQFDGSTFEGGQNVYELMKGVQVSGLSGVEVAVDETVVPLDIDKPVTFDPSDLLSANLSNYSYNGILFTLDGSNSDGIENEDGEGVIYIGSLLTDAAVDGVNNAVKSHIYSPGDDAYANDFAGGITLMVHKGNGFVKIEAENEYGFAYHVKIGDSAPVQRSSTTRKWLEVPYQVDQDTYVYIYMIQKASAARAGTRIGRRGTAHGKIYSAKCASSGSAFVMGDADGSGDVDMNDIKVIANYIMGSPSPGFFNKNQADVNGDSVVDAVDLVEVIRMVNE